MLKCLKDSNEGTQGEGFLKECLRKRSMLPEELWDESCRDENHSLPPSLGSIWVQSAGGVEELRVVVYFEAKSKEAQKLDGELMTKCTESV